MPDNTTKMALVSSFEKAKKRLVLNKAMCRSLMAITSTEAFGEWVGASVVLALGQATNGRATIQVLPAVPVVTPEDVARETVAAEQGGRHLKGEGLEALPRLLWRHDRG